MQNTEKYKPNRWKQAVILHCSRTISLSLSIHKWHGWSARNIVSLNSSVRGITGLPKKATPPHLIANARLICRIFVILQDRFVYRTRLSSLWLSVVQNSVLPQDRGFCAFAMSFCLSVCSFVCSFFAWSAYLSRTGLLVAVSRRNAAGPVRPVPAILLVTGVYRTDLLLTCVFTVLLHYTFETTVMMLLLSTTQRYSDATEAKLT